jgi:hypothetical protein
MRLLAPNGGSSCPSVLLYSKSTLTVRPGAKERDPMADVWSMVHELDAGTRERLADVLETRGAGRQQQQQAMRRSFLAEIAFPPGARALRSTAGRGC